MISPAQLSASSNLVGYSFALPAGVRPEKCNLLGYTSQEALEDSDGELLGRSMAETRAFGVEICHLIGDMTLEEDDCA